MLSLTAIVPATNGPATLPRCVEAIELALEGPEQLVVVDSPPGASPAAARNRGAATAEGDVLVFVDADVEVDPQAFSRIRRAFDADPRLTALFGSYDDAPEGRTAVSLFRNLLHHHVHQTSAGSVGTFWAGLGAIRREAFAASGGFSEHPIEDIELGMRLVRGGARIELDPLLLGKHLKVWTLWSMVRTDLLVRGAPWVGLLLQHRSIPVNLNLGWRHRASALASIAVLAGAVLESPVMTTVALAALLGLNRAFYVLLVRRAGVHRAALGLALHVLHHLVGVLALAIGVVAYASHYRRRREDAPDAPVRFSLPDA